MIKLIVCRCSLILIFITILSIESKSQIRWRPYVNVGYVTNFVKAPDAFKADRGGSLRIGVLDRGLLGNGRFGFYGGFLWFNKQYAENYEYEDSGSIIMAGVDILLLRVDDFEWYLKLGLGNEKYKSTYLNNTTETESSIMPDFGLLFNKGSFNAYLGWQPSDPAHLNIGIGFTLYKPLKTSETYN